MALKDLSGFHYQINVPFELTRIQPSGLQHVKKYSRSMTGTVQNRRYRRTRGNVANDILTKGTIDTAVKTIGCLHCR